VNLLYYFFLLRHSHQFTEVLEKLFNVVNYVEFYGCVEHGSKMYLQC